MGTSSGFMELAKKMDEAAELLSKSSPEAAMEGGKILQKGAEEAMRGATRGTGRLRNLKGSDLRVSLAAKTAGATGSEVTVEATGSGYEILDNPTKPHRIGGATKRLKRHAASVPGGGSKVLRIGGKFYTRINHPGTMGKHTFDAGTQAVSEEAIKAMSEVHVSAFEAAFKL